MGDFVCMCICVLHACSPRGSQKRLSDALRMELKKAVICVGSGNQTCVIWKSSWCSEPLIHLSGAYLIFKRWLFFILFFEDFVC